MKQHIKVLISIVILLLSSLTFISVTNAEETFIAYDTRSNDASDGNNWIRTFGGPERDAGISVQQTSDGGYIITGVTSSYGKSEDSNVLLIKTDKYGEEQWNKTFGENPYANRGNSVQRSAPDCPCSAP